MRRPFLICLVLAAVAAVAPAAASAATTTSVHGTFTVLFPKGHPASNAPCPDDVFCGVGTLTPYGPATVTILDETFDPIEDSSCFAVSRIESVDLLAGGGSLVIDGEGTFCRPGGSGDAHASPSSYGGPGRFVLEWVVDGDESTGIFAGAGGSGTETMNVNGGSGVWHLSGSVTRG